jgi:hypothetical protein
LPRSLRSDQFPEGPVGFCRARCERSIGRAFTKGVSCFARAGQSSHSTRAILWGTVDMQAGRECGVMMSDDLMKELLDSDEAGVRRPAHDVLINRHLLELGALLSANYHGRVYAKLLSRSDHPANLDGQPTAWGELTFCSGDRHLIGTWDWRRGQNYEDSHSSRDDNSMPDRISWSKQTCFGVCENGFGIVECENSLRTEHGLEKTAYTNTFLQIFTSPERLIEYAKPDLLRVLDSF